MHESSSRRKPLPGATFGGAQVLLIKAQPVDGVTVAAPSMPVLGLPRVQLLLGVQPKADGKLHLRLNTGRRLILTIGKVEKSYIDHSFL